MMTRMVCAGIDLFVPSCLSSSTPFVIIGVHARRPAVIYGGKCAIAKTDMMIAHNLDRFSSMLLESELKDLVISARIVRKLADYARHFFVTLNQY